MFQVWYIHTRFDTLRYILSSVCTSTYIRVYTFLEKFIQVYTWIYDLGPTCTIASYHNVVEAIPKRQPEGTTNHCLLAKACLKALYFPKGCGAVYNCHVSAQPMACVKRREIGKRTLNLLTGTLVHSSLNINISDRRSCLLGGSQHGDW